MLYYCLQQRASGQTHDARAVAFGIRTHRHRLFGGVDSSFWPRSAPVSCPPARSFTSPRRSSAHPKQASFERSVDVQASEEPHFKLRTQSFGRSVTQLPRLPATTPIAATTASAPALPPSSTTPNRWAFHRHRRQQCKRCGDYRPGMRAAEELGVRSLLWRSALPRTKLLRMGAIPSGTCRRGMSLPRASPRARNSRARGLPDSRLRIPARSVWHRCARLVGGCMHIEAAPADVADCRPRRCRR